MCDQELDEFESVRGGNLTHVPQQKERERTFEWVHSNVETHAQDYTNSAKQLPKPQNSYAEPPRNLEPTQKCKKQAMPAFVPNAANITDQSVNIGGFRRKSINHNLTLRQTGNLSTHSVKL